MEINLLTCEFQGIGLNIIAIIKREGKPIMKFNCQTKHIETALEGLDEVLENLNLEEAVKLSNFELEVLSSNG